MLKYNDFLNLPEDEIFASGIALDEPDGLYMTGNGYELKWAAVNGYANDWCIYTHYSYHGLSYIVSNGDKVCSKENIQKLVPCDSKTFNCYRY